jgi:hypothetical protein
MLLPKKLDEDSKVRNQDASVDKKYEWVTWKYFVDLLKEQLDMTWLSHNESLLILKEQDQETIFRLGQINKKAKEDMHNFKH